MPKKTSDDEEKDLGQMNQQMGLFAAAGPGVCPECGEPHSDEHKPHVQEPKKASKTRIEDLARLRFALPDQQTFEEFDVLAGKCSCERFAKTGRCDHSMIAHDLVKEKGKQFRYIIKSAFHKEIRRGDFLSATRWSNLLRLVEGGYAAKQYIAKVLLEETRNAKLLLEWQSLGGHSQDAILRAGVLSRKKWELKAREESLTKYLAAYARALPQRFREFDVEKMTDAFVNSDSADVLFEWLWRVRLHPDYTLAAAMKDALQLRAAKHGGWAEQVGSSNWEVSEGTSFYIPKMIIEMTTGMWDESANEVFDSSVRVLDPIPVVPPLHDYVYDNHTRKGQALYAKFLRKLQPEKPLPPGLDVRWSGLVRGVLWRERAFAQYGMDYKNQKWESVKIDATSWENVYLVDGFFYAKLYERAGILDVPLPRK